MWGSLHCVSVCCYWLNTIQRISTGAFVSSFSIYPAAKVEARQADEQCSEAPDKITCETLCTQCSHPFSQTLDPHTSSSFVDWNAKWWFVPSGGNWSDNHHDWSPVCGFNLYFILHLEIMGEKRENHIMVAENFAHKTVSKTAFLSSLW